MRTITDQRAETRHNVGINNPVQPKHSLRYITISSLCYLCLEVIFFRLYDHHLTTQIMNAGSDPNMFMFFLQWWPHELSHWANPFLINALTHPYVYNAAWLTSVPALALIATPITYMFGPIASWNILVISALFLSALLTWYLVWIITSNPLSSFLSGLLFGFSTYQVAELVHINLIMTFPLPLILIIALKRYRGDLRRTTASVAAGITFALLVYISTELMLTMALSVFITIIISLVVTPKSTLSIIREYIIDLLLSAAVFVILALPLLWYVIQGLSITNTSINSSVIYSTDIANLVVPTRMTAIGATMLAHISDRFTGNATEQTAYFGVVLLTIACVTLAANLRKQKLAVILSLVALTILILSLGPRLHIDGTITSIPLPWSLLDRFPFFNEILPARIVLYVWLCLALWIGVWHAQSPRSHTWRSTLYKTLAIGLGLVLIMPAWSDVYWAKPPVPIDRRPTSMARRALAGGIVRLPGEPSHVPFVDSHVAALLSIASNFQLRATTVPWSYNVYPPDNQISDWPVELSDGPANLAPDIPAQIAAFVDAYRDPYVTILTTNHAWHGVLTKLGWQHEQFGSALIYRVPSALRRKYQHEGLAGASILYYRTNLHRVKAAVSCYFAKHQTLSALDPAAMAKVHCEPSDLVDHVGSDNNWQTNGIWVGDYANQVAIGIQTTGNVAYAVFHQAPLTTRSYYDFNPEPHRVSLQSLPGRGPGTFLMLGNQ